MKIFLCLALASLFIVPPVFAQTSGFSVTPLFQEITLENEPAETFTVEIENNTVALTTFSVAVLDFGNLDESGGVAFQGADKDLSQKYALASWMRPETDTINLEPGKKEVLTVTIENREDLSPGGHYAGLVFRSTADPGESAGDKGIAINQVFSVLVFVKKLGGERYGLEYVGNEWEHSLWNLPEKPKLRFQNTGNVHVVPRGVISVTDPFGREIRRGVMNEESGLLLPESYRFFPTLLKSLAPALIPGRYTMTLWYRYDGKDDFTMREEKFDFLPLPAILGSLILIAVVGWYVAKRRRNTGESGLPTDTA